MKVCTDACLLGAFVSENLPPDTVNILDIGTGTGLLSIMLAQKTAAKIEAIEINEAAAKQARENADLSPWADRIEIFNVAIQAFKTPKKYDLIISNPPFFENDLKSANPERNEAKHDSGLTLQELVTAMKALLSPTGVAAVLLPHQRTCYFKEIAEASGLFIKKIILVRPSPKHDFFRSIILMSNTKSSCTESELYIHDNDRQYSPQFVALLKDFYLKL